MFLGDVLPAFSVDAPPAKPPPSAADVEGARYLGCFAAATPWPAGGGGFESRRDDLTPAACRNACRFAGHGVFGLRGGTQCVCRAGPPPAAAEVDEARCDAPCGGAPRGAAWACGGRAGEATAYAIDAGP